MSELKAIVKDLVGQISWGMSSVMESLPWSS